MPRSGSTKGGTPRDDCADRGAYPSLFKPLG